MSNFYLWRTNLENQTSTYSNRRDSLLEGDALGLLPRVAVDEEALGLAGLRLHRLLQ